MIFWKIFFRDFAAPQAAPPTWHTKNKCPSITIKIHSHVILTSIMALSVALEIKDVKNIM